MCDKDKQFEEIASDICPFYKDYGSCERCNKELDTDGEPCYFMYMAMHIIRCGYRKQIEGEWELHGNDDELGSSFFCNVCWNFAVDEDEFYRPSVGDYKMYRFCPNCGARMKGGVE